MRRTLDGAKEFDDMSDEVLEKKYDTTSPDIELIIEKDY